jgi:23S rRNA pseudouridine955/2504/2580 synthase
MPDDLKDFLDVLAVKGNKIRRLLEKARAHLERTQEMAGKPTFHK